MKVTRKQWRKPNQKPQFILVTTKEDKKLYYKGKEIVEIDYSECTAMCPFCDVRFKGEKEFYCVQSYLITDKPILENNSLVNS